MLQKEVEEIVKTYDGPPDFPPIDLSHRGGDGYRPIKVYFLMRNKILQPTFRSSYDVKIENIFQRNPDMFSLISSIDRFHSRIDECDLPPLRTHVYNAMLGEITDIADDLCRTQEKDSWKYDITFCFAAARNPMHPYMTEIENAQLEKASMDDQVAHISLKNIGLFAYGCKF